MTSDLNDPSVLDDEIRNSRWQSPSFFAKLFGAWIAMGFRHPTIPVGTRALDFPDPTATRLNLSAKPHR